MNSTIKPKPCKTCQSPYHSAMWHKPRKPIAVKKKLIVTELDPCTICSSKWHYDAFCPYKRWTISNKGKVWGRWSKVKVEWYKLYGTDHPCHYCQGRLTADTITLDHKIPRSRAPELRYDFNNLLPCCFVCNNTKGSVEHDKYPHNCNDRTPA